MWDIWSPQQNPRYNIFRSKGLHLEKYCKNLLDLFILLKTTTVMFSDDEKHAALSSLWFSDLLDLQCHPLAIVTYHTFLLYARVNVFESTNL